MLTGIVTLLVLCASLAERAWAGPRIEPLPSRPGVYAAYIKDPARLGFVPDHELFRTVFDRIESLHVDNPTPRELYKGVSREVGALLKEAHVSSEALRSFRCDRSLPDRIGHAYARRIGAPLLWYAMVRGLFSGTGDPYSFLFTPKEYHSFKRALDSESFAGVGIFVELDPVAHHQLTVVEPVAGSPAARAGIMAGDRILDVNGHSTAGISLEMAHTLIRGPVGSTVTLTIVHHGQRRPLSMLIRRARIRVPSISHHLLTHHVGYIRVRVFGEDTVPEFHAALEDLRRAGALALVIDLRNNGGGYMRDAIDICSMFLKRGQVVTTIIDRHGRRHSYRAYYTREFTARPLVPTVLLVNAFSASASEVTAGCLQDHHIATLVGTRTFGKGTMQRLFTLPDGAAFKVSIDYFVTPHGHVIHHVGIRPQITVPMNSRWIDRGRHDVQLAEAVRVLREKLEREQTRRFARRRATERSFRRAPDYDHSWQREKQNRRARMAR